MVSDEFAPSSNFKQLIPVQIFDSLKIVTTPWLVKSALIYSGNTPQAAVDSTSIASLTVPPCTPPITFSLVSASATSTGDSLHERACVYNSNASVLPTSFLQMSLRRPRPRRSKKRVSTSRNAELRLVTCACCCHFSPFDPAEYNTSRIIHRS